MNEPVISLIINNSRRDENVYNLQILIAQESRIQQIEVIHELGDFVMKDQIVGWTIVDGQKSQKFIMPLSGTIESKKSNPALIPGKNADLFSLRLCQHEPYIMEIEQNIKITHGPLFKARPKCKICCEELWYYYQKQEKQVTLYEFKSKFDDFSPENVQWKVILNQSFTKNTEIASCEDDMFYLKSCGKITYLIDFFKLPSTNDLDQIVLRYKQVVCNHQKISQGICQFCLMSVKQMGIEDLKMYLFQIDDSITYSEKILRQNALLQQQKIYRNSIVSKKKALLVLDLDNTILHSIELSRLPKQMVSCIQDYMIIPEQNMRIQHSIKSLVKLRPFFQEFLMTIVPLYEIIVYTKGTRDYAEMICQAIRNRYQWIKKTKNFLPFRVLSRNQDPQINRKKLTYILPTLKDFIVILDDRRQVWNYSPNCLYTKIYNYFYSSIENSSDHQLKAIQWEKGGGSLQQNANTVPPNKQDEKGSPVQSEVEKVNKQIIMRQNTEEQGQIKQQNINPVPQNPVTQQNISKNIQQKSSLPLQTKKQLFIDPTVNRAVVLGRQKDYFMIYIAYAMKKIHSLYFQSIGTSDSSKKKKGIYTDIASINNHYRRSILTGMTAIILKDDKQLQKRAINLGLKLFNRENEQKIPNVIIRGNYLKKKNTTTSPSPTDSNNKLPKEVPKSKYDERLQLKKIKFYSHVMKVPTISESWLNLCYQYHYRFGYQNYIIQPAQTPNIYIQNNKYEVEKAEKTLEQHSISVRKYLRDQQQQQQQYIIDNKYKEIKEIKKIKEINDINDKQDKQDGKQKQNQSVIKDGSLQPKQ